MEKAKFLVALATMLMLGACSGSGNSSSTITPTEPASSEPSSSETTSSESSTSEPVSSETPSSETSSSVPTSSETPSSEIPSSESTSSSETTTSSEITSSEVVPTEWREQDIEAMALLFKPLDYFVLPFPNGFTSSYTNVSADYIDAGYYYFVVNDYECGDLSTSYGAQLEAAGLVNFGGSYDADYGDSYCIYQYCIPDSLECITVETHYYDDTQGYGPRFEILAVYGEKDGTYFDDTFPYGRIETELGVTNASSAIPSFSTLPEDGYQSYYYYGDTEADTYFLVTGTYGAGEDPATLYSDYKAALVEFGYTVQDGTNDSSGMANNTELGYYIVIDVYDGYFAIYLQYSAPSAKGNDVSVPGTTPQVGQASLTLNSAAFPSDYPASESELVQGSITFGYFRISGTGGNIQVSSQARTSGYLWNVTSLGTIYSIEIKATVNEYYGVLSLYLSNEVITSTEGLDYVTPTQTSTGYVYNIKGAYSYFYLIDEMEYASKNTSITINYTI